MAMIRIRRLYDVSANKDKQALSFVLDIYQKAFPYYPEYAAKIAKLIRHQTRQDFEVMLLIAEGNKQRVQGFALSFFFPKLRYAYLDYIASGIVHRSRGIGAALYEANRDALIEKKCKGLFMDVPPDEAEKLKEKKRLEINKRRMAFYERYGARPIINTDYDAIATKANGGYLTFLVYDSLQSNKLLRRSDLKKIITRILNIKAGMGAEDAKLKTILKSIQDDPILLRPPRYIKQQKDTLATRRHIALINSGDANQIHHLKEKGYVEKPARIVSILKGLDGLPIRPYKVRSFSDKPIRAVHDAKLVQFLQQATEQLPPGKMLYPNVFPIRKAERIPKTWDMRAGYFCIDTFTPVTANVYKAARQAVNSALSGAELLLNASSSPVYVLCRPPGHHAERKAFGGFCYFNNAAIAAQYLSAHGKVAFLDIDYHHGNGSQDIFYKRSDVYFISIHGHPKQAYPYFAGYADETGEGAGKGYNRNYPLYPNTDDQTYLTILEDALKRFRNFKPQFFVVSLGFDIMKGDPTGTFLISPKGMYAIGKSIAELELPLLVIQEGGYSLRNLRLGAQQFFRGILESMTD